MIEIRRVEIESPYTYTKFTSLVLKLEKKELNEQEIIPSRLFYLKSILV